MYSATAVGKLLVAAAMCTAAAAQNITGTLLGDVKDPSGAAIPGVEVTLIHADTNLPSRAVTDTAGHFEAPYLKPGVYTVRVVSSGFKTAVREGVSLEVDSRQRLDFVLEIGEATATVEVSGRPTLVESETGSLGQVVGERTLMEAPLQGRNIFDLIGLVAGVQENPTATTDRPSVSVYPSFTFSDFSVNGGRMRTNEYLLDGVSIMLPENNNFALSPTPDGTQEFKVMTGSYGSQFGRTGGGVINVVTKAGTNQLHGSAYEFHRDHVLRANNFFANARGQRRNGSAANLFGASAGGPVRRNRTFFFAELQGYRDRTATGGAVLTVPTEAERSGDFSRRVASNGQPVTIFNPYTTRRTGNTSTRDPFPGNIVPSSLFDPVTRKALSYVPLPNGPGEGVAKVNNYAYAPRNYQRSWQWSVRLDHRFSERNNLFGRFTRPTGVMDVGGPFGTPADPTGQISRNPVLNGVLNETLVLGPTRLLNLRYGFTRRLENSGPRWSGRISLTDLGFPAYVAAAAVEEVFPRYAITGYSNLGSPSGARLLRGNDIHTWVAEQTHIHGRHTLVYGADIRLYNQTPYQSGTPAGNYSFTQSFTQDPFRPGVGSGDALASFLLGYGGGSINTQPAFAVRNAYAGLFVNDDLRLGRLTVNLGLRWDYEQPRTERYNRFSLFDFSAPFPIPVPGLPNLTGKVGWAGQDGYPRGNFSPSYRNLGPRAGLAYRLRPRTAIRAGYGIFYLPVTGSTNARTYGSVGSTLSTTWVASVDGITPTNPLSNPYPNGLLLPSNNAAERIATGEAIGIADPRSTPNSYMQHWNLGVQQGIAGNVLLSLSYAGSQGTRLPVSWQFNQVDPKHLSLGTALTTAVPNPFYGLVRTGTLSTVNVARRQLLRPYPQYGNISAVQQNVASSKYHSLLLQIEKRFSRGYNLMVNYTNSKLIDNGSGRVVNITAAEPPLQNAYDLRAERAISPQDVSQRLVISHSLESPFRGKASKNWRLSGTFTWNTGFPLPLTSSGSDTYLYTAVTRPNNVGRPAHLDGPVQQRLTRYFDTSVFTVPPSFTLGNTGRTLPDVRSPSRWNYNVSVSRTVRVWERVSAMLRAETFNLTNTPSFTLPGLALGAGDFGLISGARGDRQVQLSAKVLF
jgi:hypothetical protein